MLPTVFDELTLVDYYRMVKGYYRRQEEVQEPFRRLAKFMADMQRPENHPGYSYEDIGWVLPKDLKQPQLVAESAPLTPEYLAALDALDADLITP